ncbi:NAD(P)/FAD-dependent oxidoreductase [Sporocytophaga myxococcoides]|uniref:NAD(P)/FAD-dependent oxidoreductase n=1 Tax=Sporocytophaga myxococcoides TaxID=153721 RepID=UPI0005F03574|nr:FAD-binding protein [Sporocytophaga myxococcoides]
MRQIVELTVPVQVAENPDLLHQEILKKAGISSGENVLFRHLRRSIDARSRQVKINFQTEIFVDEAPGSRIIWKKEFPDLTKKPQAIVVGAGPAGLFAAIRLIELGIKPIVLERGKDVRTRRRDLAAINKDHIVNPESNYCFGEGGAGTYSDGKLYTRSGKRGDIRRILEILVAHGATEEILIDAHPHIGTNKLPMVVQELRNTVIEAGGEVRFDSKVTDFVLEGEEVKGVVLSSGERIPGIGVILATGHSARDIFYLLHDKGIIVEAKPFALGVRVEHQQSLIDSLQYHCEFRGDYLPAASYALVSQVPFQGVQRGVFSFCMCPGGFIVPAATAQEEIVVNGMSPSRRDSKFANSGIVVSVEKEEFKEFEKFGPLAGLEFQKKVERQAWVMGGKTQTAPAQRLSDFVQKKISSSLIETSYQPGLKSCEMGDVLPPFIVQRLRQGFKDFGQKMRGYLTNEAQIVGVESRTSSPVSIPRKKEEREHIQIKRLFPCGEGAGYAGGIVSAAMDGEKCAESLAAIYGSKNH